MRLPSVVLFTVLLPSVAAASTSTGVTTGPACSAARLATCASAHVQYVRMGVSTLPVLTLGSGAQSANSGTAIPGFRFQPLLGQELTGSPGAPQILAVVWGDDGRPIVCRPGGLDCRVGDPVTTPEPVTMTLVATGLVGMAGFKRIRRRQKRAEV